MNSYIGKINLKGSLEDLKRAQDLINQKRYIQNSGKISKKNIHWEITEGWHNAFMIVWDGEKDFENAVEWLEWVLEKIIKPKDIKASGTIFIMNKENKENNVIKVQDNNLKVLNIDKKEGN